MGVPAIPLQQAAGKFAAANSFVPTKTPLLARGEIEFAAYCEEAWRHLAFLNRIVAGDHSLAGFPTPSAMGTPLSASLPFEPSLLESLSQAETLERLKDLFQSHRLEEYAREIDDYLNEWKPFEKVSREGGWIAIKVFDLVLKQELVRLQREYLPHASFEAAGAILVSLRLSLEQAISREEAVACVENSLLSDPFALAEGLQLFFAGEEPLPSLAILRDKALELAPAALRRQLFRIQELKEALQAAQEFAGQQMKELRAEEQRGLAQARELKGRLEKAVGELATTSSDLEKARSELTQKKAALAEAGKIKGELEEGLRKATEQWTAWSRLAEERAARIKSLEEEQRKLEGRIPGLETALVEQRREIEETKKELKETKEQLEEKRRDIEEKSRKIARTSADLDASQGEVDRLKGLDETLSKARQEAVRLELKVQQLEEELRQKGTELDQANGAKLAEKNKFVELEKLMNLELAEKEKIDAQKSRAEEELAKAERKLAEEKERSARLKAESDKAKSDLQESQRFRGELQKRIEELTAEIGRLTQENERIPELETRAARAEELEERVRKLAPPGAGQPKVDPTALKRRLEPPTVLSEEDLVASPLFFGDADPREEKVEFNIKDRIPIVKKDGTPIGEAMIYAGSQEGPFNAKFSDGTLFSGMTSIGGRGHEKSCPKDCKEHRQEDGIYGARYKLPDGTSVIILALVDGAGGHGGGDLAQGSFLLGIHAGAAEIAQQEMQIPLAGWLFEQGVLALQTQKEKRHIANNFSTGTGAGAVIVLAGDQMTIATAADAPVVLSRRTQSGTFRTVGYTDVEISPQGPNVIANGIHENKPRLWVARVETGDEVTTECDGGWENKIGVRYKKDGSRLMRFFDLSIPTPSQETFRALNEILQGLAGHPEAAKNLHDLALDNIGQPGLTRTVFGTPVQFPPEEDRDNISVISCTIGKVKPLNLEIPEAYRPLEIVGDRPATGRFVFEPQGRSKNGPFFIVGRDEAGCDGAFPDPEISQQHAQFGYDNKQNLWCIQDMQSTNGTFLNRERIPPNGWRLVKDGDFVRLGNVVLRASYGPGSSLMLERYLIYAELAEETPPKARAKFEGGVLHFGNAETVLIRHVPGSSGLHPKGDGNYHFHIPGVQNQTIARIAKEAGEYRIRKVLENSLLEVRRPGFGPIFPSPEGHIALVANDIIIVGGFNFTFQPL
jgi:hypothetical protein